MALITTCLFSAATFLYCGPPPLDSRLIYETVYWTTHIVNFTDTATFSAFKWHFWSSTFPLNLLLWVFADSVSKQWERWSCQVMTLDFIFSPTAHVIMWPRFSSHIKNLIISSPSLTSHSNFHLDHGNCLISLLQISPPPKVYLQKSSKCKSLKKYTGFPHYLKVEGSLWKLLFRL